MNMLNDKNTPVMRARKAVMALTVAGGAAMLSTAVAYADINSSVNVIFNVGTTLANAVTNGLTSIVVPIGIAVLLYFIVRMLLASDPKDVTTYRKRAITTAILVGIAMAVPALVKFAANVGNEVNIQLN